MQALYQLILLRSRPRGFLGNGFTITEVMVAMLLIFIGGSILLASIVYATVMGVKSQQKSFGITWIQEDVEQVKAAAAAWTFGSIVNNAGVLQLSGCRLTTCGLAVDDQVRLYNSELIHQVTSLVGNEIVLTPTVAIAPGSRISFVPVKRCMATTEADGLADEFREVLSTLAPTPTTTRTLKGSVYALTRGGYEAASTPTVKDDAPYNLLELTYRVAPISGTGQTFILSTEVLPNAVLQCP